jgi:hypothetical protein
VLILERKYEIYLLISELNIAVLLNINFYFKIIVKYMSKFNLKKPNSRCHTFHTFTDVLQDRFQTDLGLQGKLNRALFHDQKRVNNQQRIFSEQKKRLKEVEEEYHQSVKTYFDLREENHNFANNYKRLEDLKKTKAKKKKTLDEENFEFVFKELLYSYNKRGYNIEELKSEANLFEPSPLLLENNEIMGFYKNNKDETGDKDVKLLERFGKFSDAKMYPHNYINFNRKQVMLDRLFGNNAKSRNVQAIPKSFTQLRTERITLQKTIKNAKDTLISFKSFDEVKGPEKVEDTEANKLLRITTSDSLTKNTLMFSPNTKSQTTLKSFSDISTRYGSTGKSKFYQSKLKNNSNTTNFTNHLDSQKPLKFPKATPKAKLLIESPELLAQPSPSRQALTSHRNSSNKSVFKLNDKLISLKKPSGEFKTPRMRRISEISSGEYLQKMQTQLDYRNEYLNNVASVIVNKRPDSQQVKDIKHKMEKYNKEFLKLDNKTMKYFFSQTFDSNLLMKQIKNIRNKVEEINIPEMYKTGLTHIDEEEENKLKKIGRLDRNIKNLGVEVAKKLTSL